MTYLPAGASPLMDPYPADTSNLQCHDGKWTVAGPALVPCSTMSSGVDIGGNWATMSPTQRLAFQEAYAIPSPTGSSAFKGRAVALLDASGARGPYGVVAMRADLSVYIVGSFATAAEADAAVTRVSGLFGHRYVGSFQYAGGQWNRKPQRVVVVSGTSLINWKSAVPWVIGGAAAILAAVYVTRTKKGKAASPRRRRAAPSWRRRIVTTWR
jgi:hypothetical protein